MLEEPLELFDSPVTLGLLTVHVYVVPAGIVPFTPLVGLTENWFPEHTEEVRFEIDASGFTITVTTPDVSMQAGDVAVPTT
jgi:hypothetical protein